jgi:hypothetical protein
MLTDLAKDPDIRVQEVAICQIGQCGRRGQYAVPTLTTLWREGVDPSLKDILGEVLIAVEPERAARLGVRAKPEKVAECIEWLECRFSILRVSAARQLYNYSFVLPPEEFGSVLPIIRKATTDSTIEKDLDDSSVGELATLTLARVEVGKQRREQTKGSDPMKAGLP